MSEETREPEALETHIEKLLRFKVVSNGRMDGTFIYDSTGKPIGMVSRMVITIDAQTSLLRAQMDVLCPQLDLSNIPTEIREVILKNRETVDAGRKSEEGAEGESREEDRKEDREEDCKEEPTAGQGQGQTEGQG